MPNGSTPTYEFVYAIQAVNLKTVKIGFSTDVNQRLKALQTGSPDELKIIGCWLGTQSEEWSIHTSMAQWLVHGEWFLPSDDLMGLIAERSQAKPTGTPGKLEITAEDGRVFGIWESARAERRQKDRVSDPLRAIIDVLTKAETLSNSLPLKYGQIAEQILASADVVFKAMQEKSRVADFSKLSPKQIEKLACSFCGKKTTEVQKLIAGPKVYICNECVTICNLVLDEKEYDSRHVYLIEVGGTGYWWSAESQEEAIRGWIRQYGFESDKATTLTITPQDDNATLRMWNGPPYNDTNPPKVKPHAQWAEEREGLIGALVRTETPLPPKDDTHAEKLEESIRTDMDTTEPRRLHGLRSLLRPERIRALLGRANLLGRGTWRA